METYRLFTKQPVKKIEEIILNKAIPVALNDLANKLERAGNTTRKENLLNNLPLLASQGLIILRKSGQKGKQSYEFLHGCILAAFLNGIKQEFQHDVYYPENKSYDFLIIKSPRGKKPDFKLPNKEIYKNGLVLKVELAELTNIQNLKNIIKDKSKDSKRILLVSFAFNSQINFQQLFKVTQDANNDNFETIWFMGQTNNPTDNNKLCYFVAEAIKHKKVFPRFQLLINWDKIKEEVDKVFNK